MWYYVAITIYPYEKTKKSDNESSLIKASAGKGTERFSVILSVESVSNHVGIRGRLAVSRRF